MRTNDCGCFAIIPTHIKAACRQVLMTRKAIWREYKPEPHDYSWRDLFFCTRILYQLCGPCCKMEIYGLEAASSGHSTRTFTGFRLSWVGVIFQLIFSGWLEVRIYLCLFVFTSLTADILLKSVFHMSPNFVKVLHWITGVPLLLLHADKQLFLASHSYSGHPEGQTSLTTLRRVDHTNTKPTAVIQGEREPLLNYPVI